MTQTPGPIPDHLAAISSLTGGLLATTQTPGPIPDHLAAISSLTGEVSVLEMEEVKVAVKASIVRERESIDL
jgi:hypothetical protein